MEVESVSSDKHSKDERERKRRSSGPADTMLRLNILCLNNQAFLPARNRERERESGGRKREKKSSKMNWEIRHRGRGGKKWKV